MADNTQVPGGTGDTVRDKDRAGVKTQIVGIDLNIGGGSEALQTAAALADATANPTIPAWASMGMVFNGTTWDRMRGDTANGVDVDVTRLPSLPTGANTIGTVNIGTAPNITLGAGSATVGTVLNVGDVDHDAVNTGKVVQTGGHASPQTTPPAAVSAAGDRARTWVDMNGASIIRPRKLATYHAVFRATARPNWLANAFGAAGRKQYATIFHAASATKTVKLRRVRVTLYENTVAAFILADLVRLTSATTPATGNPAITPGLLDTSDAAAEATCLALPTTAGTEGSILANQVWDAGVIAGAATTAQGARNPWDDLFIATPGDDESKLPTMRAGVAEGFAVTVDVNAATNPKLSIEIWFTEE